MGIEIGIIKITDIIELIFEPIVRDEDRAPNITKEPKTKQKLEKK